MTSADAALLEGLARALRVYVHESSHPTVRNHDRDLCVYCAAKAALPALRRIEAERREERR